MIQSRLYSPLSFDGKIANVSGCGDCLAAGIITGMLRGWKESDCITLGLRAANQSLTSYETVPNILK
jgi:sugar/nucleoside kinase (ribokinase family)